LRTFNALADQSSIAIKTKVEIDFEELRNHINKEFEKKYGKNIVAGVSVAQHSPYIIDVVVYVKEKKDGMWSLCIKIADEFRNQGISIGIHTELAKGNLYDIQ